MFVVISILQLFNEASPPANNHKGVSPRNPPTHGPCMQVNSMWV